MLDMSQLRAVLFHEQYVRIIDGFSADDLMRSASRGEPGPAKLCVDPLDVSVAWTTSRLLCWRISRNVHVAGNEGGRMRAWIRHAKADPRPMSMKQS